MPNFTYTRDIPFASHNPSTDQPDMQVNTNSADDIFEVDHYSFNDNLGGYHKVVHLVNQVAVPVLPAGVGSMLYSGGGEFIFNNANIPLGVFLTNSNAPPIAAVKGSTFVAGAILMQWGQGPTVTGVFNDTFSYSMGTVFGIFSGVQGGTGTIITNASALSATTLVVTAKLTNGSFVPDGTLVYWFAIGIV